MKTYTVTFILKDTQSHITSFTMMKESAIKVADDILNQVESKGFVEAYNSDDDTYHSVNIDSVASYNIKPKW
jgi:hypothetical protein